MDSLKKQYDELSSERNEVIKQIKELEESETLKKYFELVSQNKEMVKRLSKLYKRMKCKEYSECNHIWVATVREFNCFEQRSYLYRGCVKCGLNAGVFSLANTGELSFDDKIMKDYIKKNRCNDGIDTTMECDIDLAKAIYSKIKEEYPDIDDETACRYFKAALYKIRKNRVSFEREEDRAVRLSLSPNFDRWSRRDICTD